MAYAIVHFFPGMTKEHYDASMAVVHPGKGQLPDGQLFHAAGATPGGWTIIAVHESKESWERFAAAAGTRVEGLEGGAPFPVPPNETAFEVDTFASRPR
jgi:hypothetical protein